MRKIFFILLIFCVSVAFAGDAGSDIGRRISNTGTNVLLKYGICKDANGDCIGGEYIFFEGNTYISTYNITNMSALQEIMALCIKEYEHNKKTTTIILASYKETHRQANRPFVSSKPFLELTLRGVKK
jgi:hypothetical protein